MLFKTVEFFCKFYGKTFLFDTPKCLRWAAKKQKIEYKNIKFE